MRIFRLRVSPSPQFLGCAVAQKRKHICINCFCGFESEDAAAKEEWGRGIEMEKGIEWLFGEGAGRTSAFEMLHLGFAELPCPFPADTPGKH